MRKLFKLVFQRVVIVAFFILLQLALVLLSLHWLTEFRQWIQILMTALSVVMVVSILCERTNASYKLAWIILILAVPVAGIGLYLTFGGRRLRKRLRRNLRRTEDLLRTHLPQERVTMEALRDLSDPAAVNAKYIYNVSAFPVYDNTLTEYYPLGDVTWPRMLQALEQAEHYIFLEYFIIDRGVMWDSILEILKRKAAAGLDVRVLYDDFGCITTLPGGYNKKLARWGIRARAFNPFVPVLSGRLNNRSHRKLMIIDGKVGFTGGINLADEYINRESRFGHWKDCGLRLEGEAVWSMTMMFLTMWDSVTGEQENPEQFRPDYAYRLAGGEGFVQPFSDTPLDQEDVAETVLLNLFRRAVRSIWIMTPYLVLDDAILNALISAAQSGLDVRLMMPGISDKWYVQAVGRAHYEPLIEAGVKVYEYTPGFVHSKVYLVDDRYAVTGTVNLDFRSLYLHYENAVYLFDAPAVAEISEDFRQTFPKCEEITLRKSRRTNVFQRLLRTFLRMFSPLL